jgi:glycosyltransferase involved in cell wall biosynthesis
MTEATPLPGVTVATPWYPTMHNPVTGSFVAEWTGLARRLASRVRVVHAEEWPGGTPEVVAGLAPSVDAVLGRMAGRHELDVSGRWGTITRVPTVIQAGFTAADRAEAAVESTRRYAGAFDTPVVHGHVGYLGGLTAARLADPDSRVFVTEHSSGLGDFLSTPRGQDLYAEVLDRAHRLTCVSSVVRDLIVATFPSQADRVVVVPNPVDFDPAHRRASRPDAADRWVFAGGLSENKGVVRLVEAFARFARDRGAASLDIFGAGALESRLRDLAHESGVGDRVRLMGNVPHDEFLRALPQYDVLLAPSRYETFHLVVPEAVAAGVPVVVTRSGGPEEALDGVEDLVGRFVDVNDDPGEIVEAVLDLERGLDRLDLDAARETLAGRYGHDAVAAELSTLYGCEPPGGTTPAAPPTPRREPDRDVVLVSVSGWRKYAVAAYLDAVDATGGQATLVTRDAELMGLHPGTTQVQPAAYLAALKGPVAAAAAGTAAAARGLVRRVLGRASAPASPSAVPAVARPSATHIVCDVASFPIVEQLMAASPELRLAIEPDLPALGRAPVDAP